VQKIEAVEWPVEEFVLIDSTVTRSGSEYQVLKRWPLA
jgi:2'-5' RNA ligase